MILSQAILFVNFNAETILKICAKITCKANCINRDCINHTVERILRIISKCAEMRDTTKQSEEIFLSMTDILFSIPRGKLILRQFEQPDSKGALIFYGPHYYSLETSLPRLINNYKCVYLDNDLTYALAFVLTASLNIKKIKNREIYTFILPDFVNIFIEHVPTVAYYINIQVLVKSIEQNINKSCNDALEILQNLIQELSITEDELISPSEYGFVYT